MYINRTVEFVIIIALNKFEFHEPTARDDFSVISEYLPFSLPKYIMNQLQHHSELPHFNGYSLFFTDQKRGKNMCTII